MTKYLFSKALGLFVFVLSLSLHSIAQPQTVSSTLNFSCNFTNVDLDPNGKIGASSRSSFIKSYANKSISPGIGVGDALRLIGADVSIPSWVFDLGSYFCSDINAYMNINGSIDVGAYYEIHSIGKSQIDITYPVKVNIIYPKPNSFACGDIIRIYTNYENPQASQANMNVKPPFLDQEIGPIVQNLKFGASIGVSASAGIGVDLGPFGSACQTIKSFNESYSFPGINVSLPSLPPLLNICDRAFGPGATNATVASCAWSPATPILNLAQQRLDDYNQNHHTSFTIFDFPNQNTVHMAPPDLPDGPTLPEVDGTFKNATNTGLLYNLISDVNGVYSLKVAGTKTEMSQISLDLISLLDYAGITTSKSLGGGLGSIDIGDAAPTLTIDQNFKFLYTPVVHLQIDLGISMAYTVYNANNTVDHTGNGRYVQLLAGQYIAATIPQAQTTPLQAGGQSTMDGAFSSKLDQDYYRSLKLAFGQLELKSVFKHTLWEDEVLKSIFDNKTILDHSFNLAMPRALALPSFVIDPENPVIDISSFTVQDVRNIGGGQREVIYKLAVQNQGDVDLHDVQVDIDLATAFANSGGYTVECMYSGDLIVNNGFNGSNYRHMLASGNTLNVGQTKYIEFVVLVRPNKSSLSSNGCFSSVDYSISAKAFAVSPIGTHIQSDYNQCTMSVTGQDIAATVNLGAEPINSLTDFTIYGWKTVVLDKYFKTSYGHVGSAGDISFENVSLQDGPAVEIIGDLYCNGKMSLLGESKVIADYIQNRQTPVVQNFKSGLFPTGVMSNNSNCVTWIAPLSLSKPQNTSSVKVNVNDNASMSIAPGSYNEIVLGTNSVMNMTSGVYNIDSWKFLGNNARVNFNTNGGSITIHVDKFQPLQREGLQMKVQHGGVVSNVMINVYGNQPAQFSTSLVQAILTAPNAEVEFGNNSHLDGSCFADKVNFRTGSTFKGVKYNKPLNVSPSCQNLHPQNLVINSPGLNPSGVPSSKPISVFPNPSRDEINISGLSENSQMRIFDLQGKLLMQTNANGGTYKFNISSLASGIYLLKVDQSDFKQKIVKM